MKRLRGAEVVQRARARVACARARAERWVSPGDEMAEEEPTLGEE